MNPKTKIIPDPTEPARLEHSLARTRQELLAMTDDDLDREAQWFFMEADEADHEIGFGRHTGRLVCTDEEAEVEIAARRAWYESHLALAHAEIDRRAARAKQ